MENRKNTQVVCSKLQLYVVLRQLERRCHYSCIVTDSREDSQNIRRRIVRPKHKYGSDISTYIKMFKGRPEEEKSDANFLTDANELRSNSTASTLADGISLIIASLTSSPADIFLIPITTFTPRRASTRAVSEPIPLDAPAMCCNKDIVSQGHHYPN